MDFFSQFSSFPWERILERVTPLQSTLFLSYLPTYTLHDYSQVSLKRCRALHLDLLQRQDLKQLSPSSEALLLPESSRTVSQKVHSNAPTETDGCSFDQTVQDGEFQPVLISASSSLMFKLIVTNNWMQSKLIALK